MRHSVTISAEVLECVRDFLVEGRVAIHAQDDAVHDDEQEEEVSEHGILADRVADAPARSLGWARLRCVPILLLHHSQETFRMVRCGIQPSDALDELNQRHALSNV